MSAGVSADLSALVAVMAAVSAATGDEWLTQVAWAGLLLALGLGLFLLEFVVLSHGLCAIGAAACAGGAVWLAFDASAATGWAFLAATPILAGIALRWSLARIEHSRLVTSAEIDSDAGYHHAAEAAGVAVGAQGVLVTDARPTGRARFAHGEIDVAVRGAVLSQGAAVIVRSIEGPLVVVGPAAPEAAPPLAGALPSPTTPTPKESA